MDALGIAVRFGLYLALLAGFGLAAFGWLSLAGAERQLPLRRLIGGSAVAGMALSVLGLLTLAASMNGTVPTALDRASVMDVVQGTAAGTAWAVRMAALAAMVLIASWTACPPHRALGLAALAGAVAVATLAWGGHGAADESGPGLLHLGADIAHLLAAGVWHGALIGLLLLAARRGFWRDPGLTVG